MPVTVRPSDSFAKFDIASGTSRLDISRLDSQGRAWLKGPVATITLNFQEGGCGVTGADQKMSGKPFQAAIEGQTVPLASKTLGAALDEAKHLVRNYDGDKGPVAQDPKNPMWAMLEGKDGSLVLARLRLASSPADLPTKLDLGDSQYYGFFALAHVDAPCADLKAILYRDVNAKKDHPMTANPHERCQAFGPVLVKRFGSAWERMVPGAVRVNDSFCDHGSAGKLPDLSAAREGGTWAPWNFELGQAIPELSQAASDFVNSLTGEYATPQEQDAETQRFLKLSATDQKNVLLALGTHDSPLQRWKNGERLAQAIGKSAEVRFTCDEYYRMFPLDHVPEGDYLDDFKGAIYTLMKPEDRSELLAELRQVTSGFYDADSIEDYLLCNSGIPRTQPRQPPPPSDDGGAPEA